MLPYLVLALLLLALSAALVRAAARTAEAFIRWSYALAGMGALFSAGYLFGRVVGPAFGPDWLLRGAIILFGCAAVFTASSMLTDAWSRRRT